MAFTPLAAARWFALSLAVVLLVTFATGCATTAKSVGANAAPAAVQAGLREANAPDAQNQIQTLIDSHAFQNAGQSVGEGVGIGLFNEANKLAGVTPDGAAATSQPGAAQAGTSQPASEAGTKTTQPSTRAGDTAGTPGAAAVAGLAGGGGGLSGMVQASVQTAFLAATDPKFKEGERALSEAVGEGFVQGMLTVVDREGPHIGKTVQTQLGPIFQMLIRDQIAPAIRDTLQHQIAPAALQVWKDGAAETLKLSVRADMQPDVVKNAENASIGASRGTERGLINMGVLSAGGGLTPRLRMYLWAGAIGAGVIGVALLCLLLLLNLLVLRYLLRGKKSAGLDSGRGEVG